MKRFNIIVLMLAVLLTAGALIGCGGKGEEGDQGKQAAVSGFPEKPINMVIAFTAGGSSDVQARIMQKYWDKYSDQPWVFIYKPGAGGAIGFADIAKAKADGYTIGGVNVPHIILQPLGQGAQYQPEDFAYIAQVVNDPQVLAVKIGSKFNSAEEAIEFAKANPGKLKVGIVGTYTGGHLALLDFQDKTGTQVQQVVYKGAADQNAALLGGEIDVMLGNYNDVMRTLDQMNILAVTATERMEKISDVPTFQELGYDLVSEIRRGFVAPKGIGEEELKYLRETFNKIAQDPGYIADMEKAGQPSEYLAGASFEEYVVQESKKATETLKKFNLIN